MIGKIQITCCVCGVQIPYERPEILMSRGLCTTLGTGARVFHCRHHTADDIVSMLNARPVFVTAKEYGISPAASHKKPEY